MAPRARQAKNKARIKAYQEMAERFRPSHADYTYEAKFGRRNWQGGGRASARETIGRVAAGNPILAEENIEDRVDMPAGFFQPRADYLLRVRGDSAPSTTAVPPRWRRSSSAVAYTSLAEKATTAERGGRRVIFCGPL